MGKLEFVKCSSEKYRGIYPKNSDSIYYLTDTNELIVQDKKFISADTICVPHPKNLITLYVSPRGSDSYTGLDSTKPLKTIQEAVNRYNHTEIFLESGEYAAVTVSWNKSTHIKGKEDKTSIIKGDIICTNSSHVQTYYVTIQDGQLSCTNNSYIYFSYSKIEQMTYYDNTYGIVCTNCSNINLYQATINNFYYPLTCSLASTITLMGIYCNVKNKTAAMASIGSSIIAQTFDNLNILAYSSSNRFICDSTSRILPLS